MKSRWMKTAVLFLFTILGVGCAGGRGSIRFENLDYPVSLSQALFDSNGNVVIPDESQRVGRFESEWNHWTILWTLVPLSSKERYITPELWTAIDKAGGNAVVNLKVYVSEHPLWVLTSLLPIIPTQAGVRVEADIVKI